MYDMMIRLYCRVFHATLSPFHHQWKISEHETALQHDRELIALFVRFQKAEAAHCKLHRYSILIANTSSDSHDQDLECDFIYNAMFAEKKNQHNKAPADLFVPARRLGK